MTAQNLRRDPSRSPLRSAFLVVAGLAVVATIAACSVGAAAPSPTTPPATPVPATPAPSAPSSEAPSEQPSSQPSPAPSEDPGEDPIPITVELETADGHDVRVDIVDLSGLVDGAVSGNPRDGMSVDAGKVAVENIDDRTLRLTWVDFGMDNALALYIDESAKTFILVQPGPTGAVDAMGFDRQLELTFEAPISAADLLVSLQDGIDTPGA